jgi:hypothetical protein
VPDEHSNLNTPRRSDSGGRRRGRRGGRSRNRNPRPATEPSVPENAPAAETPAPVEETAAPAEAVEHLEPEADPSGGFREPHADAPEEFASHPTASEETPAPEPAAEAAPEPPPARESRRNDRRDERPPQPPPRVPPAQRQWVKPADFRPAAPTAITQAVEHATFIAEALRQLHEQMDEILELVEIAERQKLADEREIDELRRALRRIQPSRREQPQQPSRASRHEEPRRERRGTPPREEPPVQPEPETSAENPASET